MAYKPTGRPPGRPRKNPIVAPSGAFHSAEVSAPTADPVLVLPGGIVNANPQIDIEPAASAVPASFELEKFMHETVIVELAEDPREGALPAVQLDVNGEKALLIRGRPVPIKRKFVEALARARETHYEQHINQAALDDIKLMPKTGPSYQFVVIEDSPSGRAWCKKLLQGA